MHWTRFVAIGFAKPQCQYFYHALLTRHAGPASGHSAAIIRSLLWLGISSCFFTPCSHVIKPKWSITCALVSIFQTFFKGFLRCSLDSKCTCKWTDTLVALDNRSPWLFPLHSMAIYLKCDHTLLSVSITKTKELLRFISLPWTSYVFFSFFFSK